MQAYLKVQSILTNPATSYPEFQSALLDSRIDQQIYLNLFLTLTVLHKNQSEEFLKFVELLSHFGDKTGKKSADINYVGYKDKACQATSSKTVQTLLTFGNLDLLAVDPLGRNACYYALKNQNELEGSMILAYLFQKNPDLVFSVTFQGQTLLFRSIQLMKVSIVQFLLKCGINPNQKLPINGNTPLHQIIRQSDQIKKETAFRLILILFRFKANFYEVNNDCLNVFQYAKFHSINVQEIICYKLPLNQQLSADECSSLQNDKQSLQSFYQQTKFGDSASQSFQGQSCNNYSQQVDRDFSQGEWTQKYSFQDEQDPVAASCQKSDNQSSQSEESKSNEELFLDYKQINFVRLSQEVMKFSNQCQQAHTQCSIEIEHFLQKLSQIIKSLDLSLEVVGSFATGLWFPYSDIDIAMTSNGDSFINFELTLQKVYKKLKHRKTELGISNVVFAKGVKISSIKVEMNYKLNYRRFDLSIFHKKNMSKAYVVFICETLKEHCEIKPLFFVFKRMCQTFDLHDQAYGGLKTYALFLMILMVVKSFPNRSVGELIYHISLYFGFYFEYCSGELKYTQGDYYNQLHDQKRNSKMRLNLIDPLNYKNNVGGKNTKIDRVQNMFRSMHYAMHKNNQFNILEELFQLHTIM